MTTLYSEVSIKQKVCMHQKEEFERRGMCIEKRTHELNRVEHPEKTSCAEDLGLIV